MTPLYAVRRDANQSEIVEAMRKLGWTVEETHACAQFVPGITDLIADKRGRVLFVEVKVPGEKQTDAERAFQARHPEAYRIVYSVDDVLRLDDPWMEDHA